MFIVEVMVVKQETEWTMWSVAPMSMIQSWGLYACLSTYWAENIEWDKFGGNQKGLPKKLLEK